MLEYTISDGTKTASLTLDVETASQFAPVKIRGNRKIKQDTESALSTVYVAFGHIGIRGDTSGPDLAIAMSNLMNVEPFPYDITVVSEPPELITTEGQIPDGAIS